MPLTIKFKPDHDVIEQDGVIELHLEGTTTKTSNIEWRVRDFSDKSAGQLSSRNKKITQWRAIDVDPGVYTITAEATTGGKKEVAPSMKVRVQAPAQVRIENPPADPISVDLQRAAIPDTPDLAFWEVIKLGAEALSFDNYKAFVDYLFCKDKDEFPKRLSRKKSGEWQHQWDDVDDDYSGNDDFAAQLPFPDIHAYRALKAATEAFMMVNCEIAFERPGFPRQRSFTPQLRERLGLEPGSSLRKLWDSYLTDNGNDKMIPYLRAVQANLEGVSLTDDPKEAELCNEILRAKVTNPCLMELIWSYWHEEGMLVQTLNAISLRFENRRGPVEVDPLAGLAIDPLRPLGNLIWGYIQDEQHRLTISRRVYEYDHEYGLTLLGQAVPQVRGADTRSRFLEAFHNLLHRASIFYKEDDDTTMIADAFPVLNALREVHLLLAEGAHNQYGDLPWTARQEMLMQQWILARPEFREFLPSRIMVPYPEPWMQRVDTMKRLQGWTETSVRYFRDLGVFGEQIVLSVRFGNWSNVFDREQAGNWARFWRQEVQWYMHAYQAVTGVDLSADTADIRQAEQARERAVQPAFHLQRRLVEQRTRTQVGIGRPWPGQPLQSPAPPPTVQR
jgi:hypothetical protein